MTEKTSDGLYVTPDVGHYGQPLPGAFHVSADDPCIGRCVTGPLDFAIRRTIERRDD